MQRLRIGKRQTRTAARAGAILVEYAILVPVVFVLIFGIIEMGYLFSDLLIVSHACTEGARVAGIGETTTGVDAVIADHTVMLYGENLDVSCSYRSWIGAGWSSWQTLTDGVSQNSASTGDEVRISVVYTHPLIAGGFFPGLADEPGGNSIELDASRITRRE